MAGSFYRAPAPGEPSFCKEGDKVTKGQTVCIIEAMKLMNEIEVTAAVIHCVPALSKSTAIKIYQRGIFAATFAHAVCDAYSLQLVRMFLLSNYIILC